MSPTLARGRTRYVPAVSPRLRKLLLLVLVLFGLLAVTGGYLGAVTMAEWASGQTIQGYAYQVVFLVHLVLGLAMLGPYLVFGVVHFRNSYDRKNRLAVRAGLALFLAGLALLGSGLALARIEGLIDLRDPGLRGALYWVHVLSPLLVTWLFVLHRLAGPRIRWRVGLGVTGAGAALALGMVALHFQDPRAWNVAGPESGEKYFFPSLARTATGNFIPAKTLMNDKYCQQCHADVHADWSHGVHRFSSFNNPAYLFSVRGTRKAMMERDGNVQGSRFCAGCHDPVPFFSGAFDDPDFDDVNHPTAQAGITCTACHAITHINTVEGTQAPRGNADYTIEEPIHYPFASSESPFLRWVNRQLVKAKPAFHKKTFLKPLHRSPEFCGSCHKVHLPEELNGYKYLRGQNHYDAYHLSGVSGHGITSFYYPPKAQQNCNGCHMPAKASDDFGARVLDESGELKVHDHQFPSANTAIPHMLGMPEWVNQKHRDFLEGVMRLDLFGVKEEGRIDGELHAPLRPALPVLQPGRAYLLEAVIRTMKMGHLFTQGTADSNEVWLDVTVRAGDRVIGRSGGRRADGGVDPWSHFVNAYVLDRDGNRIDRRNAEDIFVPLYNNQIPPGAADVVHLRLEVPPGTPGPISVEAKLQYRKFDTTYMQHVEGPDYVNDLPITTLAEDRIELPVAGGPTPEPPPAVAIPPWQRWNDYGIALFRKGSSGARKGELRQAAEAFAQVEELGRPDGPLNLARTYIKEGRLADAVEALGRAATHDPPAPPWSLAWFSALVDMQNGNLDRAIEGFTNVVETRFEDARGRGFDFAQDYRVRNMLGVAYLRRAYQERGEANQARQEELLARARAEFEAALRYDSENVTAHYNLAQLLGRLGDPEGAAAHEERYRTYKPDENARDRAIHLARAKDPAADHAAEAIVIHDLQRPGAYELPGGSSP